MNIDNYFKSFPKYGKGVGLHRIKFLVEPILETSWFQELKSVHITGSNGKGSTAKITTEILNEFGFNVGLFISPHLFSVNERFSVKGECISDIELEECIIKLEERLKIFQKNNPNDHFGRFEIFTAVSFYFFYNNRINVAIIEAGIGGRFDTTRIYQGKINVLTSIDLEHTKLLGSSEDLIMYDKTDILNSRGLLISGKLKSTLRYKLKDYAYLRDLKLIEYKTGLKRLKYHFKDNYLNISFNYKNIRIDNVETNLKGNYQINNSIISIKACYEVLKLFSEQNLDEEKFINSVEKGLKKVIHFGRFQEVRSTPSIYIDVCHTPSAAKELQKTIKNIETKNRVLIIGVSEDKKYKKITKVLGENFQEIIFTKALYKGVEPDTLLNGYKKRSNQKVHRKNNIMDALKSFTEDKTETFVLIAGSLYLAIEAAYYLDGKDPANLDFY